MGQIGHQIVRLRITASTINAARHLAEQGAPHGTVIMADRQTKGRGRRGRGWVTIPGKSLAATVIVRELPDLERLTLAPMVAALAVVRAAKRLLDIDLHTKWPNDVIGNGRKIAGALAEIHDKVLFLSLGVNVNGLPADLPRELLDKATTLEMLSGRPLPREPLIQAILNEIDTCWRVLLQCPNTLVAEWMALDTVVGQDIVARSQKGTYVTGHVEGIDEGGRLIIRLHDGTRATLEAGDVTLSQ